MDSTKPPKESERRIATVLFADISGFTSMSERLDPEEVTDVISRCLASLADAVSAHGGFVDKYIGDCVMALFGVPAARETAPRDAVNAAIEMRNRVAALNAEGLPAELAVHTGINTGLVIAGNVGGDVKQEFTVVGDAVNLASRLKDKAPNGTIWVGRDTYLSLRGDFEFRKLEPLPLKGKAQPVQAYELLSATEQVHRPRPGSSGRMVASSLVGREREVTLLGACVGAAARGEGGIVSLVGEAGLGKSRLLAEVWASSHAEGVLVLEGRSLSMGAGLSFHPFADLLRQWAGIGEEDGDAAALEKLEAAIGAAVPDGAADVVPFIGTLMGIRLGGAHAERVAGITGESLEKLILKAVRELLEHLAGAAPLVLVFEDLHWADRSSIQLLDALLRLATTSRILFVHAFRPDHEESSQRILHAVQERYAGRHTEVHLEPLDGSNADTLVRNLLQIEDLPYSTLMLIRRTAEGNPFYLEEVVRALIDEGAVVQDRGRLRLTARIESVVIPGTIQGVILSRVDRLPVAAREVLQVAAVLGRSMYYRVLAQVAPGEADLDTQLAYLQERQLLFERESRRTAAVRRRAITAEVEWVFKHALVQETVYESILQRRRRELHRRVAAAIEAIFADRLSDFFGMLAYHYSRAEDVAKTEEYVFKAGDEAARTAASTEALAFFREASRLYFVLNGEGGDSRKKALLEKNIALALVNTGELTESIEHFDRAFEHLGERVLRGGVAAEVRWAVDLAAVLLHVYGGRRGKRGAQNLEHEREVCELFFYRGLAEVTSDPRRLFRNLPTGLRRFNRIDPTQIEQACAMYVSCAGIFAYSGISFAVSQRMLDVARGLVREGSVRDQFVYETMRYYYHYLLGDDWSDTHSIDPALIEQNLRIGQLWDVNSYLGLECDRRLRRGEFAAASGLLNELGGIADAFGYAFAGTNRTGMTAVLRLEERRLPEALEVAQAYQSGRYEDALRVFGLGLVAKTQALLGDLDAASASLAKAEETLGRSGPVSPWHQSGYLVSRLLVDVTRLEDAMAGSVGGRVRARLRRAAVRSARRCLRVAGRVAKERVESHRLAGRLAWLLGRRRRAVACWERSLAEGERLGARPELARTHEEIGRRLGKERAVGGLDAAAHLERARHLFAEVGIAPDAEALPASAATG